MEIEWFKEKNRHFYFNSLVSNVEMEKSTLSLYDD